MQALLASCDRGTAGGRRDLAMLTLLARMGLRAGRGRRAAPGRHRLAARRDHHRRQGQPPRPAPAARRRGRGSRGLAAAWPAAHGPGPQRVHPGQGAAPGPDGRRGHAGGGSRPGSGPGWARSTRTGCGTAPPPPCSPRAGRWPRSARCCGTGGPRPRRHIRRSTSRRCARWPARGREPRRDRAAPGAGRLPGPAPRPGVQAGPRRQAAGPVHHLPGTARDRHGHRDRRAGLGHAARRRQPGLAADADAPWSAASPPTLPPSTPLPRCPRPACCRAEPAVPCPTCIPPPTSPRCSPRRAGSRRRCARRRSRR